MYHRMSEECKKSLKRQFDFSALELDQMEKFMTGNTNKPVTDILDTLMKNVDLNDRQKVIVSYTLGASVGAEAVMQDLEESNMTKVDPMLNIKIGQGG
jgi:uncharacterized membrane protein YoaK (UPF0700 family)